MQQTICLNSKVLKITSAWFNLTSVSVEDLVENCQAD